MRRLLPIVAMNPVVGRRTHRRVGMLAVKQGPTHFEPLTNRCVTGEVKIHIDRTFPLDAAPQALAYVGDGRALGKVVVTVA